jgi:hypothetical protein
MWRTRQIAFASACAALVLVAHPPVLRALAFSTGGVSAGPLHWDPGNPATRNYFIPTIAPGGTYRDDVRVGNPNADAVDLVISAVDGVTAAPSGAVYANRADPVHGAGGWVSTDLTELTLGAGQSSLVGFTVTVPVGAVPGDHLAGIAFENAHTVAGNGAISITSVVRTVVGVLVKVPGPASFDMAVGAATIQPLTAQGLASVVVSLTDTGRLLGRPTLRITLSGPGGYRRAVTRNLDTILPGDTIAFPFPWPDALSPGMYTIDASATGAGLAAPVTSTSRARLSISLKGVPGSAAPSPATTPLPATSGTPAWLPAVMIAGGALLAVLVVTVFLLVALLRRQRRRGDPEPASAMRGTTRATDGG